MVGIRTNEVYKHRSDEVADAEPTEERGFTPFNLDDHVPAGAHATEEQAGEQQP